MELKFDPDVVDDKLPCRFNRTFMELKFTNTDTPYLRVSPF